MKAHKQKISHPNTKNALTLLDEQIPRACTFLQYMDEQLKEKNIELKKLQPNVQGKISLQWIKNNGQIRPQAVRWISTRTSNGYIWHYKKLPIKHLSMQAPRKGAFFDIYPEIRKLLKELQKLMELRSNFLAKLQHATSSISLFLDYHIPRLETNERTERIKIALINVNKIEKEST